MMKDDFGDRMKFYERLQTLKKLDSFQPYVYARIDGRGFSKFTRGIQKPFDSSLKELMVSVTETLVKETHAIAGYTQSDEISLAWNRDTVFFGGKIQKIASILAGMTTSFFVIKGIETEHYSRIVSRAPHFDARVFEIPNEDELANAFLWRYNDCHRNAIQSIGQYLFSQKQLNNKSMKEVIEMLASIGVFETDFPKSSIHGTFIKRVSKKLDTEHGLTERDVLERASIDFRHMSHTERKTIIFNKEFTNED
jgi:tRNA(His) guanylyltransferase